MTARPKKKEVERILPATDGLKFKLEVWSAGNKTKIEITVGPKCDKSAGQWACATHGVGFGNNMEKDSHIDRGKHVLVWMCNHHGPEIP